MSPLFTQVLVSVRTAKEAEIAARTGVQLIDLKEPLHGPLGMVDDEIIQKTVSTLRTTHPSISISLATGEATDWQSGRTTQSLILPDVDFLKMGLFGLVDHNWVDKWIQCRDLVEAKFSNGETKTQKWVAVIYADAERNDAPHPVEIIEAASATNCVGVLFDTYYKNGKSLFDVIQTSQLTEYLKLISRMQMFSALAGSISVKQIPLACSLSPNILGFRSAACVQSNRTGKISSDAIESLLKSTRST